MTKILQADQDWLPDHIVEVAHLFDDKLSDTHNLANNLSTLVANNQSFVLEADLAVYTSPGLRSPVLFTFKANSTYLVRLYLLCQSSLATNGVRFCPVDTSGNAKQFAFRNTGIGATLTDPPPISFTQLSNSSLGTNPVLSLTSASTPDALISTSIGIVSTHANLPATLAIQLFPENPGTMVRILAGSVFDIQKIS